MSQQFKTVGVLRLEVEDDPTGLVNLIVNTSGEMGGYGWVTPTGSIKTDSLGYGLELNYAPQGGAPEYFASEPATAVAGHYVAASWVMRTTTYYRAKIEYLNSSQVVIGSSAQTGYLTASVPASASIGPSLLPAGTAFVRLRFDVFSNNTGGNPIGGQRWHLQQATMATAATSGALGTSKTNLITNPSFETDTAGWTADAGVGLTRVTTQQQVGAAALEVKPNGATVTTHTNLVRNPSFETNVSLWSGASLLELGGADATLTRIASTAGSGSWAARVNDDAAPGASNAMQVYSSLMDVTPSTKYYQRVSARVSGQSNRIYLLIAWYTAADVYISTAAVLAKTVTVGDTTWYDLAGSATAPSNAAKARVVVRYYTPGETYVNGSLGGYFDAVYFGSTDPGSYFDGSTPDAGDTDYSWTGTAHASTSTKVITVPLGASTAGVKTTVTVQGSKAYTLSAYQKTAVTARSLKWTLDWYAGATLLSSAVYTVGTDSTSWTRFSKTITAPAGATSLEWSLRYDTLAAGESHYIDAVMVQQSSTLNAYFEGTVGESDLSGVEPVPYLDVLGPTHDIKVVREALNVGTLTATILDSSLDPSQSDLIRPGRRLRLMTLDNDSDEWSPLFMGKVVDAAVTYELKNPNVPDQKRARIELTASDPNASLAQQTRSEGVTTIDELRWVVEGCGVPWNINGSGQQYSSPPVVAVNDNASALDQIAVTRDSNLGYAWVDRYGVLQVWDAALMGATSTGTFAEAQYTDLDLSFNSGDLINEVTIKFLRLNPATGETEEIPYGPYRDETSINEWGVRSKEFTVQGISEETADLDLYAQAILTANSTPEVRINSVTMPVTEVSHLVVGRALHDLYDLVVVSNASKGISHDSRITTIEHSITPDKWMMKFGFSGEGVVASPTFTPSPQTGAGGKTLGQLLRPIGEVTMFYGAKADIPAGWLPLDGSTVPAEYADLIAHLGGTTLPNFTDRLPIGAGTKALGTTGGAPTKTLSVANLPAHKHDMTHGHTTMSSNDMAVQSTASFKRASNTVGTTTNGGLVNNFTGDTGNTGSGTAFDVMNPWLSLWFIMRAI
ncbi:tail fiber protein [Nocardioides sp. Soil796]|uniref:tail fiber protein n=1 Tax=Nocardioides sp. Soil796 TaxID=1736412 RepID=UPI00070F98F8|nr:tail fiber protein [Nocardioides sp. Soil796]KRF19665.1 hypothetical protein ASH02_24225 [Nocardioides sp. Soil796]